MLKHVLSHKSCGLLSGANKGASTAKNANRWVNGKVCHAETNVRLVRQFRAGWVLKLGAPAPCTYRNVLFDRALLSRWGAMEIAMSRTRLFPVVLIWALALSTAALAQGGGGGGGGGGGAGGSGGGSAGASGGSGSSGTSGATSNQGSSSTTGSGTNTGSGATSPNPGMNNLNNPNNTNSPNNPNNQKSPSQSRPSR
jgi:hypothetical protein